LSKTKRLAHKAANSKLRVELILLNMKLKKLLALVFHSTYTNS